MPAKKIKLSIVIPVYNEVGALPELMKRIDETVDVKTTEVVFIDDGSTDGSSELLEKLKEESKTPINLISLARNVGKSLALSEGLEEAKGELIAMLDADLQNDPYDLPKFLEAIDNGADFVIGWREQRDDPLEKRLPSKFFNWVTSRASGLEIHDFNCGFKVHRREILEHVPLYGDMHRFLPMLAHKKGFNVKEIVVQHHPRVHGVSKYGWERYLRGALDLITVMFLTSYLVRPMHLFGGIGLSTLGGGFLMFCYLVLGRWIWGESIGTSPLLTVSFFAMGTGVQLVLFGLLAEMVVHWQQLHGNASTKKAPRKG